MRPTRLVCALMIILCTAQTLPARAQVVDEIDAIVTKYHELGIFDGSVLVAEGETVLYEKGFGQANRSWGIPNAPDTKFRIGSITKQFTAALILQLVEEGKIDLKAPIRTYLPAYPASQGKQVTVHHLLTHTSGIPNYTSLPGFMTLTRNPYAPDSFVTTFASLPLEFKPGSEYNYSNSGYFLLGVLIEHVTGKPYDVVLRERLLAPLGLNDTGYDHYGNVVDKMATGYMRRDGGYAQAAYLDTSIPYAAGMLYSTVRDLHKWNHALHSGKVFKQAETLVKMTTPVLNEYGYGVAIFEAPLGDDKVKTIAHGGGIFGFSTMLRYMPEEDRTVIVFANTEGNPAAVAEDITRIMYGVPVDGPKPPIADVLRAVITSEGIDAAVAHYRELKAKSPEAYDFDESQLNALGYSYLSRGEVATALRIFQLNVEVYPASWNPYDSLGEAFLAAGDTAQGIENYRRALELNPQSESAADALKRLGVAVEDREVKVPATILEAYVGKYALQPNFILTITRKGDRLFAQATGQGRNEIFAASKTRFFLKVVDAQITFHPGADGKVNSLTLHQAGHNLPAERVD